MNSARPGKREAASERLLRCLWYAHEKFLKGRVVSLDGKMVSISSPGIWNTGPGPDFLRSAFYLGARTQVCGDVEIHRSKTDWKAHGHHRNPAFRKVKLHVFMHGKGAPAARHRMTEICLSDQLRGKTRLLLNRIRPEQYPYHTDAGRGGCSTLMMAVRQGRRAALLTGAGHARLAGKALSAAALVRQMGEEQAIYQCLMESLGYAAHKEHFRHLARLIPWHLLRRICLSFRTGDRRVAAEATLLGAAGLLPPMADASWDRETKRYWQRRHLAWGRVCAAHKLSGMKARSWRRWGSRPANAPLRRICGISTLLSRCVCDGLTSTLMPRAALGNTDALYAHLSNLLDTPCGHYWSRRFRWGGRRISRGTRLIGRQRILETMCNVILPFLCCAGKGDIARTLFDRLPSMPPNSVIRLMQARLLGGTACCGTAAQQGLLHIYKSFCYRDRSGCERCRFPGLIALNGGLQ